MRFEDQLHSSWNQVLFTKMRLKNEHGQSSTSLNFREQSLKGLYREMIFNIAFIMGRITFPTESSGKRLLFIKILSWLNSYDELKVLQIIGQN